MIDTTQILKELSNQLVPILKAILEESGVKSNSDLIKSIGAQSDDKLIQFIINDYYEYVSSGRRSGARKVPIENLLEFIKKNNIAPKPGQTSNQLAFAIQNSIYKSGIQGKHYVDQVLQTMGDYSANAIADEYAAEVADEITLDLTQK
jgi:hypothetical protein